MNIRRFANSLITRLVLFGVFVVVVSAIVRYNVLIRFLEDEQAKIAAEQQSTIASYLAQDIGHRIEERQRFLEHLAAQIPSALLVDPAAMREWLRERQDLTPLFDQGLFLANASGLIVVDYPTLNGRRALSLAGYADYRRVLEGATTISEPLSSPASGHPILPMMTPVRDADGKVAAILGGSTDLHASNFLEHLQQARLGPAGGFQLISPTQRRILAAHDRRQIFTPLPPTGADPQLDRAVAGFRGTAVGSNASGIAEIKAIAAVPGTSWLVIVSLPLASAMPTVERTRALIARGSLIQGSMVMLLLVLAYFWFFRPLRHAAALADKMTRGEMALSPLPVVRRDEVGYLTMAFNGLLARLKLHQSELQHQAHHDVLTGLPNRMMLAERMQHALSHACRDNTGLALLFLDLDGFKPINDTLGHKAGDIVLQEVARRLRHVARHGDTLARVGGDEFVLLATDLQAPFSNGARALAEKCIRVVSEPLTLGQGQYRLGVSIGIAVCDGRCDADSLLQAADKAMYSAKAQGRGCYVIAPAEVGCAHAALDEPERAARVTPPAASPPSLI